MVILDFADIMISLISGRNVWAQRDLLPQTEYQAKQCRAYYLCQDTAHLSQPEKQFHYEN